MALVNEHFLKLPGNYLFADIAKKVNAFKVTHPKADIISLGIGDVTQPLCPAVIEAMHRATDEMATRQGFRGYGPEQGYDFLREAILKNDFLSRGIHLDIDEIFVNDGAKSDTGNIQELVRWDNSIGVTDPIYPVYIDSNVMIGRAGVLEADGENAKQKRWSNVTYMPCTAENGFVPQIPENRHVDVVYLCYPNNPTGTVLSKQELRRWVNYALHNDTLIFFDAAYHAFITDPDIPHSIYEIRGARKCAIEFRSYSKTAGFTGLRCGYTVVPKELTAATLDGQAADPADHRLLYEQRPPDARHHAQAGLRGLRRRERALYMDEDTCRNHLVAVLRAAALRSQRGMHARRGLRSQRRRLRALHGFRHPREHRGGAAAHRTLGKGVTFSPPPSGRGWGWVSNMAHIGE